jgi:hypothetical protein
MINNNEVVMQAYQWNFEPKDDLCLKHQFWCFEEFQFSFETYAFFQVE